MNIKDLIRVIQTLANIFTSPIFYLLAKTKAFYNTTMYLKMAYSINFQINNIRPM